MSYTRVIPRDFFNESKLLKCWGQLALNIHDDVEPQLNIEIFYNGDPFQIEQDQGGDFYIANAQLIQCDTDQVIRLSSSLNSKEPYTMLFDFGDYCAQEVFLNDGSFTAEFLDAVFYEEVQRLR